MAKHSPGPWKAHAGEDYRSIFDADGNDVVLDAMLSEANARLIAAAPDLLEALKLARECIAYCRRAHPDAQSGDGIPVETVIAAAIQRAEEKG